MCVCVYVCVCVFGRGGGYINKQELEGNIKYHSTLICDLQLLRLAVSF